MLINQAWSVMALSRVSALLLAATYEHPPCALIESGSASWPARPCLKEPELWPEWRPPLPVAAKGLARQQRREAAMRARGIEPPKPRGAAAPPNVCLSARLPPALPCAHGGEMEWDPQVATLGEGGGSASSSVSGSRRVAALHRITPR